MTLFTRRCLRSRVCIPTRARGAYLIEAHCSASLSVPRSASLSGLVIDNLPQSLSCSAALMPAILLHDGSVQNIRENRCRHIRLNTTPHSSDTTLIRICSEASSFSFLAVPIKTGALGSQGTDHDIHTTPGHSSI